MTTHFWVIDNESFSTIKGKSKCETKKPDDKLTKYIEFVNCRDCIFLTRTAHQVKLEKYIK
jgi:hypothetical protein